MIPVMIPTFIGRWQRGLRYAISVAKDPALSKKHAERIVPLSGSRVKWYDPTKEHELLDRLMEVASGLTDPVEFADEYGLLGYAELHPWEGIPTPEQGGSPQMGDAPLSFLMAEDAEFARQLANPRAPAYIELAVGEPLYWFKAHAQTVRAAHDLIMCLKLRDENRLRELLNALPRKRYAALGNISDSEAFYWVTDYAARDLIGAVHEAIIALINPNIQGLQRALHVDSLGQLRTSLTFTALIQVIYWHLAERLDADKQLSRFCKRCGEPFFATEPRQLYCPKPLGKSRSVCGLRFNKKNFKDRWPSGKSENSSNKKRRRRQRSSKKRRRH